MGYTLRTRLIAAVLALAIGFGAARAVADMIVFDPAVLGKLGEEFAQVVQMVKVIQDTYSEVAGIYSEVAGYIQFAQNIIDAPGKYLLNTIHCLVSINIGPMTVQPINLCDAVHSVINELTVTDQATGNAPSQVSDDQFKTVTKKRVAEQQQTAIRAIGAGRHDSTTVVTDSATNLRDLQIAASSAMSTNMMLQTTMQGMLAATQELIAIHTLIAYQTELAGIKALRETPVIFTDSGSWTPSGQSGQ